MQKQAVCDQRVEPSPFLWLLTQALDEGCLGCQPLAGLAEPHSFLFDQLETLSGCFLEKQRLS